VDISASGDHEENLMVSGLREIAERQNEIPIHPDIPAEYGSSLPRAIWQQLPRAASSQQSSATTFYSCRFGSISSASQTWTFPLKPPFLPPFDGLAFMSLGFPLSTSRIGGPGMILIVR
jgi:hypothetical protein